MDSVEFLLDNAGPTASDGEPFIVENEDEEEEGAVGSQNPSVGDGLGPRTAPSEQDTEDGPQVATAALIEKIALLSDQLKRFNLKPVGASLGGSGSEDAALEEDDDVLGSNDRDGDMQGASGRSCSPAKDKAVIPPGDALTARGVWSWERTEQLLLRCLKTGAKGVLPTTVKGQESAKIYDVFDAQMAVQWVRRMEQLRANMDPLPMRGPFNGKLPAFKRLQENPMRMAALPVDCDLKLSPDEKSKVDHKPYRLGNPPVELMSDRAYEAWQSRSVYLKQFEVISLQLERLAAIQTMVVTDLIAALKQKENTGSAEVRGLFSDINPRLNDLRCINDFLLNRSELLAYSTYKASKCIYLEGAGFPKDEWGQLISRKWGATELFDSKDTSQMKQRVARMQPEPQPVTRRPPLLCSPMQFSEPVRPVPPPFFREHPQMRGPMNVMGMPHPMAPHGAGPGIPPPFFMEQRNVHQMHPQQRWNAGAGGYPPMGLQPNPNRRLYDPHAASNLSMGTPKSAAPSGGGYQQRQPQILKKQAPPNRSGGPSSAATKPKRVTNGSGEESKKKPSPSRPTREQATVLVDQIESLLQEVMLSAKEGGFESN